MAKSPKFPHPTGNWGGDIRFQTESKNKAGFCMSIEKYVT